MEDIELVDPTLVAVALDEEEGDEVDPVLGN